MANFTYYFKGKLTSVPLTTESSLPANTRGPARVRARQITSFGMAGTKVNNAIESLGDRASNMFNEPSSVTPSVVARSATDKGTLTVPTESLVLEGASKAAIKWLQETHGFVLVDEASYGKALLRAPEGGDRAVAKVFEVAKAIYERGGVKAAHPNFIRMHKHIERTSAGGARWWNLRNDGNPGVLGADVAAHAAWMVTKGRPEIRIAVLDEGVDTKHPALRAAVVAEHDFVDGNAHARPDGNDAHGTACAGVMVSRDSTYTGIAPDCSLVAIRMAKGDGRDGWISDDFQTGKAIDWAWNEGKADVLSNSWSGGPPVDNITQAIDRARTQGRNGKGAIVVFAAGNENGAIAFPSNLSTVMTVGASNWFDKRKAPNSADGERWGSCYGEALDIVAPGVRIATTDINGTAGYSQQSFMDDFNGTSSATPHVAAAAALVLSKVPALSEEKVRAILCGSSDRINTTGARDNYVGHGRLNIYNAVRLAHR